MYILVYRILYHIVMISSFENIIVNKISVPTNSQYNTYKYSFQ